MIRGIIFDCYGVLIHGSLQYLRSITPDEQRQAFDDLARASDRGYISQVEYTRQVSRLTGHTTEEVDAAIHSQEIRSVEAVRLAASFHDHYKTALLSNVGRGAISRSFEHDELKALFDAVVLSSEVGMTKPDIEIYRYAASQLGLKPDECIMVDDTRSNVEGAEMAGMHGVVFADVQQCQEVIGALLREESHA
jgi:HAD superfamily hydrolase (TIGR01509 family)